MGKRLSIGNMTRVILFAWLAAMGLCASNAAYASDKLEPLNFKGVYQFQYAGMPFGKVGIEIAQSPSTYNITVDVLTSGIVKMITAHSSHTVASGKGGKGYPMRSYASDYQTKKKLRSVKITTKNGIITEELSPPDNRATRPAVSVEAKKGAYDPLTLNIALRQAVWDAVQSGKNDFTLKLYDGRRLTQINGHIDSRTTVNHQNNNIPAIVVAVRRQLLEGFTQKELDKHNPKEPTLYVYYTDDERFIPVRLEVAFLFDTLSATLAGECGEGESCLLGNKN